MKPLKFGLVALVVVLAIAVVYGYGIGNDDDGDGGAGDPAVAAESGEAPSKADGAESGAEAAGGGGATDGGGSGDGAGKGGGSSSDGATLSKAAYVKRADAICRKVPPAYEKLAEPLEKESEAKGKGKPPVAEVNLKAAVPPLYTAIEELEGLSPPSGEEQQVEAIIDALGAAAKGLEAKPSSELSGPKSPFAKFQKLSGEYGLEVCRQL